MEVDTDEFYYCDNVDFAAADFSMGSFNEYDDGSTISQREETRVISMNSSYKCPSFQNQDLPSKRKRNPSLKEASTGLTTSSGSHESSIPPLQSPNYQSNHGIVLGLDELKLSSPGVTFSEVHSILPESSRNGGAGKTRVVLSITLR